MIGVDFVDLLLFSDRYLDEVAKEGLVVFFRKPFVAEDVR